jgi:hypothetical protein
MEINPIIRGATASYGGVQTFAHTEAAKESLTVDLSESQKSVKTRSESLKSDNDLFGAIKTLERSLNAIKTTVSAAQNGEIDRGEAAKTIADRVENTRYKNQNLYENFPLKDGSAIDARDRLALGEDADSYAAAIDDLIAANAEALSAVKSRLLGETKKLGDSAQKSYERSGLGAINPADIVANTDVNYLRTQFTKLMREN